MHIYNAMKTIMAHALRRSKMAGYVESDPVKALDMRYTYGMIDKKEYNEVLPYL